MTNHELTSEGIDDSGSQVSQKTEASKELDLERASLALKYLEARRQMNEDLAYSSSYPGDYLDDFATLEQRAIEAELITPSDSIFHQPKKTQ